MKHANLDPAQAMEPVHLTNREIELSLPPAVVHVRSSGIEFLCAKSLDLWTELTVTLETPAARAPVQCTGIVVGCHGNGHEGFVVSIAFTRVTPEAQSRLELLAAQYAAGTRQAP